MFTVDSPGFPIALLAILAGLRLAMYVYERLYRQAPAPVSATLTPDEPLESATVSLVGGEAVIAAPEMAPQTKPVEEEGTPLRFLVELLDSGIIAVVLVFFLIRPFILQAFFIPSGSMVPTLRQGDRLIAEKFIYHFTEPKEGDVVVFHAPKLALEMNNQEYDPGHPVEFVKRVIGVPGDHVKIKQFDGVYINDNKLNEPYTAALPDYNFPCELDGGIYAKLSSEARPLIRDNLQGDELVVPKGYLLVLGDNRTESLDGHLWGLLPRNRVIGKAFIVFWPWGRKGLIR